MRDMQVDASSIHLEIHLEIPGGLLYYYIFISSRAATILGSPALYYYISVSSRAATILGSPAVWGRLVACGRLSIGQMSLTSSTPRLRLAALRGRLRTTAGRRVANPPQDAILPHVRYVAQPITKDASHIGLAAVAAWPSNSPSALTEEFPGTGKNRLLVISALCVRHFAPLIVCSARYFVHLSAIARSRRTPSPLRYRLTTFVAARRLSPSAAFTHHFAASS
jgi:hypothetical protein